MFYTFYILYNLVIPHLPSFPTRRSSDLERTLVTPPAGAKFPIVPRPAHLVEGSGSFDSSSATRVTFDPRSEATVARSEEHTSELQSRGHLVCRLLLEKKKIQRNNQIRVK